MRRANHFEAQFYERESKTCNEGGRATSLGVFSFDPADEQSLEAAAEQAARASDRATVMFYQLKGASAASIQARLNVRTLRHPLAHCARRILHTQSICASHASVSKKPAAEQRQTSPRPHHARAPIVLLQSYRLRTL